ncbi:hypothetical protein PR001_g4343 [Phytophthora rubi]|uniref:Helitron helicase-like domain-containing protein n=1 Tax=Phytophthora rubi TaxID=129364 RepID=A0A6A3P0A6_9STRA|nr:hypothetical protein PR001_g4343 [Phytophthora rubi]
MALREHTAYRLFQKVGDQSALHQGGRLFQQWVVDQRAKCEQEQLRWVATHQKEIRANQYHGVEDALLNESTITLDEGEGLTTAYQDFMAIVREYGKPDVFVTITCNPKWEEIEEKITDPLQSTQDRPDIVARVWQQRLKTLLKDLDEGVLGRLLVRIYVVEFQKRGLPHAHILIILEDEDKPRTREIIDKLVSTELPDLNVNPDLFDTVMTCMMHGPCGEAFPSRSCMKDEKCSKGFPKPLVEVTRANQDGYPVYRRRRREPGVLTYKGKTYDNETVNQWVVPYNPYLSQKYNCHINVEVCTPITTIKYMYKYVYKGSDRAVITIKAVRDPNNPREEPNEILRFLNARYIPPSRHVCVYWRSRSRARRTPS